MLQLVALIKLDYGSALFKSRSIIKQYINLYERISLMNNSIKLGMIKSFFFLFFSITSSDLICQTTVIYKYKRDLNLRSDSIFLRFFKQTNSPYEGDREIHPFSKTYFSKNDTNYIKYTIKLNDTTCSFNDDLFGHEVIIIPKDTLEFTLEMKPIEDSFKLNKKFPSPWMLNLYFSGKNKFIYEIFDSLAFVSGDLRNSNLNINIVNGDYTKLLDTIFNIYKYRLDYLNKYCLNHNIPKNIQRLVTNEIRSSYLINLLSQYKDTLNYKTNFHKAFEDIELNDSVLFFQTILFSNLVLMYERIVNKLNNTEIPLVKTYSVCKEKYTNPIRDYLLHVYVKNAIINKEKFADSLLFDFKQICTNLIYLNYLDSLKVIYKQKQKLILLDALNDSIIDTKGNKIKIKNLLKDKFVVLDCWASWCKPCLLELPFSMSFQKIFKEKVDFIFLSFDRDKSSWLLKLKSLKFKGKHYLLNKNFESNFANYFNINSIPRYLIFNNKGQLVSDDAPRPSEKIFTKMIDKLITK